MSTASDLLGLGVKPEIAQYEGETIVAIASSGTAIGDATVLTGTINQVSVGAANRGVLLPALISSNTAYPIGKLVLVSNLSGANNLKLYPPSASGTINGGTAGAAIDVAATESAYCLKISATDWLVKILVLP
jgi:hypothetical protein